MIEAMDRFVKRTGLYKMAMIERPEPRNLRWLPLIILCAVPAGYALLLFGGVPSAASFFPEAGLTARLWAGGLGMLLFFGAYGAANYIRFFGPRIMPSYAPDAKGALDERDLFIRARAHAASGSVISLLAILGCFWFGIASLLGGWLPGSAAEWILLGMALQTWVLTLPVLVASWVQPRLEPDE
jgi:hypothetical protein